MQSLCLAVTMQHHCVAPVQRATALMDCAGGIRDAFEPKYVSRYSGDKNIITFGGDHNSPRPAFFFDSVDRVTCCWRRRCLAFIKERPSSGCRRLLAMRRCGSYLPVVRDTEGVCGGVLMR